MTRDPYPLQWPANLARVPHEERRSSVFRSDSAYENAKLVLAELNRFHASHVVITSDLPRRADGLPYSSGRVDDPGIAVYAVIDGHERVFACDRWNLAAHNLLAIAKSVEAMRGIARWGMADVDRSIIAGFAALPRSAYRTLMRRHHPDVGGDPVIDAELNAAMEDAELELGQPQHEEQQ